MTNATFDVTKLVLLGEMAYQSINATTLAAIENGTGTGQEETQPVHGMMYSIERIMDTLHEQVHGYQGAKYQSRGLMQQIEDAEGREAVYRGEVSEVRLGVKKTMRFAREPNPEMADIEVEKVGALMAYREMLRGLLDEMETVYTVVADGAAYVDRATREAQSAASTEQADKVFANRADDRAGRLAGMLAKLQGDEPAEADAEAAK